jgi:hypothetical protein
MNIDFKQLEEDREEIRYSIRSDDNAGWDAWDRISMILDKLIEEETT